MSRIVSVGEALARRRLKKISVMNGTKIVYQPGQYRATKFTSEDVLVSYVDKDGYVNIIPCELKDNDWFHRGLVLQCSLDSVDTRSISRSTPLWDEARRAIQKVMTPEKLEPPPPPQGDGGGSQGNPES